MRSPLSHPAAAETFYKISRRMTFHVCKVMTQVTGQRAHPHTRSPQSFNRNITDSILNRGYKYRVQSHARIQEFLSGGGGGVQALLSENSSSFLVLNIVRDSPRDRTPTSPLDPRMKAKTDLFSFPKRDVYLLMLWPRGSNVDMKL